MTTSTHVFFQDSRIRPTPAPFAAPIERAIAATLDEALQAALFNIDEDEDALRRSLEGDDRLEDAVPAPVQFGEAHSGTGPANSLSDDDNKHSDELEDTQPLHLMARSIERPTVDARTESGSFVAPTALLITDIFAGSDADEAGSGRQVLDQDLRAQRDEDEPTHELEFFSRFST